MHDTPQSGSPIDDEDQIGTDMIVYGGAMIAATGYAWVLDRLERAYPINPDFTILETIGGTSLCLTTSAIRIALAQRQGRRMTAWRSWNAVLQSFVWASIPITIWQALRILERRRFSEQELAAWSLRSVALRHVVDPMADEPDAPHDLHAAHG